MWRLLISLLFLSSAFAQSIDYQARRRAVTEKIPDGIIILYVLGKQGEELHKMTKVGNTLWSAGYFEDANVAHTPVESFCQ